MPSSYKNNFIVYKSSAGSGKTFTLVKEYLKLALGDKYNLTKAYKGILAITFTNKAASEMKWRIIRALKEISYDSNIPLAELVSSELNINVADLKERATIVLTDILHHYSDFSIGTIDSFTHRIIRTFALDLKLPINFQIETDSDTVFKKVISTLINNLGRETLITDYLVQFSLSQIEDNKHWNPEQSLLDFIKEINKEGSGKLVNQLSLLTISDFENIKKNLKALIKTHEEYLKLQGTEALKLIHEKQLSASAFASGGSGIYNLFVKLSLLKETSENELFGANVVKTLKEDKWHGGKASKEEKLAIDSIKEELGSIARKVLEFLRENEQRYNAICLIYKNIYAMGLVNELVKLTNEYKADENILFISEFNERISNVVNNEPTPFIFERLGDKYKHFLLDEFQDTSAMQWKNMLPLIDNSLANGNMNLIVGDGKQSIYRWRNADVEQFVNLPIINAKNKNNILLEREETLIRNFEGRILDKNYRSESVVVKFNNALFAFLSETVLNEDLKKIYHNQAQEHKSGDLGYVTIDFPTISNDDDADGVNTEYILKHIQKAIEDGYSYSDICIIIRQNKNGNTVANFLIEHAIPVVSADSLLLNNAKEITVILAFLKYISNQKDLVSGSVIINYLWDKHICNEEQCVAFLRDLNVLKNRTLFDILSHCDLRLDIVKLTSSNLFDSCLEIIKVLKLNESNPQYIRFFLDEVLGFLQSNTSNISLFIDWWKRRSEKASVIIPEGINAVNIMTIHASKGLEFPIVISPFLAWEIEKTQSIWVELDDEEINLPVALINTTKTADDTEFKALAVKERQQQTLDSLNMLYVDFTRAVDRLHIVSPKPKKKRGENCHYWLANFAATQGNYNDEQQRIEFGMPATKPQGAHFKIGLEQLQIKELIFHQNTDVIKIKEASSYAISEELTQAREYGILVHYILSKIKTVSDIDEVIHHSFLVGDLSQEESIKMVNDVKELLNIGAISDYFKPGVIVKNELEILTHTGEVLRPDRIVIQNKDAIVIDYKTGKKNAAKYHGQMNNYENALLELGYTSVKKILLYIQEQEVEVII